MRVFATALTAMTLASAGCSIRPLPQDVTGVDTYEIVRKIRCETREAIGSFVRGVLKKTDPKSLEGVHGIDGLAVIKRSSLSEPAQFILEKYDDAAIVSEFTFDITEKNNLSGDTTFVETLNRGPFSLALSGKNDRQRQNTRNFRVQDTFEGLLVGMTDKFCERSNTGENWIYPITGTVGMQEMVGQFLDMNQSGGLIGLSAVPTVPALADTIIFTTTFGSTVNPSVILAPLGKGLSLASAGITVDVSRTDFHKMIVAISLPVEVLPQPPRGKPKVARSVEQATTAKASARTRANDLVDYQYYLSIINAKPAVSVSINP